MTASVQLSTLLELVRKARGSGHCCFTTGDFCYRWTTETSPDVAPTLRFWPGHGDNSVAGFSWLSGDHLHIITTAEVAVMQDEIVEWGERRFHETAAGLGLRIPIDGRASAWQDTLARRGYRPGEPQLVQRMRPITSEVGEPVLPDDYSLTHVQHLAQMESWAAAYRAAFAPEEMTLATCRAVSRNPLYRPELDLIACDRRGEVAAFALAWFDPVTSTGTFEPLGCAPAHQRRGLSRALMQEALGRLQDLGATQAWVTTTRGRAPANRLYASLGFEERLVCHTWSKQG